MKKVLFLLFFWAVAINAQSDKITGTWLMTKAEINGETKEPYQIFEFTTDGKLLAMGMDVATWKYDDASNAIVLNSKMDKDFNGANKLLTISDKEMTLEKDGEKYYYTRIDYDKIFNENKKSGITGVWEIENDEGAQQIVKFEEPDNYMFIDIYQGTTETARGNWIYNPDEKSLIVVSFHNPLRGKSMIAELTSDKLVLKKDGETFVAKKETTDSKTIERLTFTEDDFPEEQPEVQLPEAWYDFGIMVEKLGGVKELKFKSGRLINGTNSFNYTTYISKITVDKNKPSVRFTNFFDDAGEMSQYAEHYKGGLSERYNNFFPKEEPYPYRSLGVETITVPAGTFECTVIEGFDMDKKIKYWLINDLPGVYAKTIEEGESPLGDPEYFVKELESVEYNK